MQDMNSGLNPHDKTAAPPTYIYTPPPGNPIGFAGFVVSLTGMVACLGLICPIGLLLSLFALVKSPRGYAIAGSILGVFGSILCTLTVLVASGAIGAGLFADPNQTHSQTSQTIDSASVSIDKHFTTKNLSLPDANEGNLLIAFHSDEWGNQLLYTPAQGSTTRYTITSAGPDGMYQTSDDIAQTYNALNAVAPSNRGDVIEPADIDEAFEFAARTIAKAFPPDASVPTPEQIELQAGTLYDAWHTPMKIRRAHNPSNYNLDSAGPDKQWNTDDDITRTFPFVPNGQTDGPL